MADCCILQIFNRLMRTSANKKKTSKKNAFLRPLSIGAGALVYLRKKTQTANMLKGLRDEE